MKKVFVFLFAVSTAVASLAQEPLDTNFHRHISLHFQATVIPQYHFDFAAPYTGANSFLPSEPVATSLTTTLFINYKAAKNTYIIFNPEAAAGKGLSKTQGIAGFPNGEVYRVGSPKFKPFIARLYIEQRFALSKQLENVRDDENQVAETAHKDYFSVIAGKFSLTDFFDNSEISHDPRTQFMNWSLMGSGAWDYPANTRGYTMGVVLQAVYKGFSLKYANTAMPKTANGENMEWKGNDAMGQVIEASVEKFHLLKKKEGRYFSLRAGFYSNHAHMGNYALSVANGTQNNMAPDIDSSREYGRAKNGYYGTLESHWGKIHHFIKHSWNDGKNETWAFTEIDNSIATGFQFDGSIWKRKKDVLGIAFASNGISNNHRQYLANGGYGFIIGDGGLNYAHEKIVEAYYSFPLVGHITATADYQYVTNPAYNKDRGPVQLVAVRLHLSL
ncbi:carbohydrate porin [Parasediminibacterium sp. JCM 36343]|uniref:carbohydrate porin n=1 Tax=Parasediminibacterium sp. JCM 36343 TaxID=3374279 RepID=UPI003978608E